MISSAKALVDSQTSLISGKKLFLYFFISGKKFLYYIFDIHGEVNFFL